MLTIATVNWRNYQGRGADYVNRLFAMVSRNLPKGLEGRFVCLTDDPSGIRPEVICKPLDEGSTGWFNKLQLFKPGQFDPDDRVVYFDLDTLITGPLDDLVSADVAFAGLEDLFKPGVFASGVMTWRSGWTDFIWEAWVAGGKSEYDPDELGDGGWLGPLLGDNFLHLQKLFPGMFVSFKRDCRPFPPRGASVVCFHGHPRPHEIDIQWVTETWSDKSLAGTTLELLRNTHLDTIARNKAHSLAAVGKNGVRRLKSQPRNHDVVAIVGGGPSVRQHIEQLYKMKRLGMEIWALNGAYGWLQNEGIIAQACVIIDARPENLFFLDKACVQTRFYLADQCDPRLYDKLRGDEVIRIDLDQMGNCGTTVGTHAITIAYVEGFRRIHLFGFDSSYEKDAGHAYEQALNAHDTRLNVWLENGEHFEAAPWMYQQAQDFISMVPDFMAAGAEFIVHGHGLLPAIARTMNAGVHVSPDSVEGKAGAA